MIHLYTSDYTIALLPLYQNSNVEVSDVSQVYIMHWYNYIEVYLYRGRSGYHRYYRYIYGIYIIIEREVCILV